MKDGPTVWWCPSDSDPSKPYVVDLEGRNGKSSCDCEDYKFRSHKKSYKECKHGTKVFRAFAEHKLREIMIDRKTLNQVDGP